MIHRTISFTLISFVFLLALLTSGCASASEPSRDNTTPKIIAVGDIHGDHAAYKAILKDAALINDKGDWTGGDTIFVQTGDIADRGPDTRQILEHLRQLQKQASKAGGQVVTLLGNHEAMNMTGDLRYVHAGEYAAFENKKSNRLREQAYKANKKNIELFYLQQDSSLTPEDIKTKWLDTLPLGRIEHQKAWSPRGELGKWIVKNKAVAMVAGNLFVHGGLSEKYTSYDIRDMNKAAQKALKAQDSSPESIINDPLGPLWYRGLVSRNIENIIEGQTTLSREDELNLVLNRYNAKRVIVGHTPSRSGIESHFDTKLIQIDTGASAYYGGTRSFLRIEGDKIYVHDNGETRQLK